MLYKILKRIILALYWATGINYIALTEKRQHEIKIVINTHKISTLYQVLKYEHSTVEILHRLTDT
jgi:uncharacterized protein YueI